MNLSRIKSAEETENGFDYTAALDTVEAYKEEGLTSEEVEFRNYRNIPDRLLMEFSPWKNECRFDPDTGIYRLKIHYHKQAEADLTVRLLGYGNGLWFTDVDHPICSEIIKKLDAQLSLMDEAKKTDMPDSQN